MHLPEHNKNMFITFLSGTTTPFPHIYDAVSEQLLLLILKARQLNEDPEYSKWFAEQHQVLTMLQAQSEKINKIFLNNSLPHSFKETKQDSLINALTFMYQIYIGFDEGKVSLKTWGEMNRQRSERGFRYAEQNRLWEEFIHDDMFAILTEGPTHCPPIPPQARKGYCHQDLSIAHSCSNELLSRLNNFHKIDSLPILADAIYNLITFFRHAGAAVPVCLSEFEKVHSEILVAEMRESYVFKNIIKLINDEGRNQFIERLAEQLESEHAYYLFDQFIGIYASEIAQWIAELNVYFKDEQSTPFAWKFTTIAADAPDLSKEKEQKPTVAWESDYCQISIKRETLLKLIQINALHDAADSLADCLLRIYGKSAEVMFREKGAAPPISDTEHYVYSSNSYHFKNTLQGNYLKSIGILQSFEKWHENNKVLLISHKKKRIERIDVQVRLAGLRCYDLKMGVPDGNRLKVKDGVYDLVKHDTSLRFKKSISDISLQRYHSQVKTIISKDIDDLLLNQQNNNSKSPFSGAYHAIKPLWSKCEILEGE
ncbi:hypothetical protein KQ284_11970 [Klebsiella pneumoniae]|jgi:hypothetical protein|uniref:hypothetical protein n=1 Tax=Klebsiella pneumoniae TaxID=573 RepID=UPI001035409C|nr:hypothetical protein [Klebsiella pneumoniae]MBK0456442.1 hypothetical protein [Klebsiella pneumoniae]MCS6377623.1 hypothetical protein [Klebsiella pneumoniae]MCX2310080.1 hypothetical protein [Klebsiella pneumoniae]MCY0520713.1 hypothetical protein [Klebsiella pneumoniae]MDW1494687.1 hypothetical protein [Klebsiella pneumoniae]